VARLKRVCVFCGSATGLDPRHREAAAAVGRLLANRKIGLVYGGGAVGLMGVMADAALEEGGDVIGIIPHGLAVREVAHQGVTDLRVVPTMHARKAMMNELSDAFLALPGGYGTLEELFEVVTWAQLGIHHKPIGLLNVAGYFDPLVAFLDQATAAAFIRSEARRLLIVGAESAGLLDALAVHTPPESAAWITPEET
jgi:uncharacterized protein (TIGR00730 family)